MGELQLARQPDGDSYLLDGHHNLHGVQAVQAQVVRKVCALCDLSDRRTSSQILGMRVGWDAIEPLAIKVETHVAGVVDLGEIRLVSLVVILHTHLTARAGKPGQPRDSSAWNKTQKSERAEPETPPGDATRAPKPTLSKPDSSCLIRS
jgi:hypothetical protein